MKMDMIATTFINGLGIGLLFVLSVILAVVGIVLVVLSFGLENKREKANLFLVGLAFVIIGAGAFVLFCFPSFLCKLG
jgi:hypothetical protein